MLNIANELDRREAKLRERKQEIEQERRKRIFNVKKRVIGVDVPALEKQMEENELKKREEMRVEKAFNDEMKRQGSLAYQLSLKEQDDRHRIQSEIIKYRMDHQKMTNRREFDLNDPDGWKKDIPPCNRDDIGISSAQKFADEDRHIERQKLMKEQRLAWTQQQARERKQLEEETKAADKAFKQLIVTRAQRGIELEKMEKICRKKVAEATLQFNLSLAEERRMCLANENENDLQDKKAEIYNNLTSGLLLEVHDQCASALGPKKIIGGAYKGMTPEERERVRKDQIEQIAINKKKRDEERLQEKKWIDLSSSIMRSVYIKDTENQKKVREAAKDVFKDNVSISTEQNLRKGYFRRLYSNNQPSDEYHKQFNTTTR